MDSDSSLLLLGRPLPQVAAPTASHRLEVVNRAARYIEDNLGEPITLSDVSRAAGMSKFHLHRVFEENVGTTLGRYLNGVRLKEALDLLSDPKTRAMSVLEVAIQVGFEDASAFARSFHRRYGITPSSLRRGHRPREFPLPPAKSRLMLDDGVTVVALPQLWIYGYEVSGQEHKTFTKEAPDGFKLARDSSRRHGLEGLQRELALPTYSWILPERAWTLLCGFRSSVRLDLKTMTERRFSAGSWLRARHTGPYGTRWQTWERLQLQQLRLGRPEDDRAPFEEEVALEPSQGEPPCCDVYFPC